MYLNTINNVITTLYSDSHELISLLKPKLYLETVFYLILKNDQSIQLIICVTSTVHALSYAVSPFYPYSSFVVNESY